VKTLLFIDTNILLDFYRVRGKEASIGFLKHIDQNHDRIITTHQVEMEFKKNRQRVILEAFQACKEPNLGSVQPPGFLLDAKPAQALARSKNALGRHTKSIRDRIAKVLEAPTVKDPVFRCFQRLFRARAACHLLSDDKAAREIERLALRRFLKGQPPRKMIDTSFGDAVNWEWIIRCAERQGAEIIIVTRDGDYGVTHNGRTLLNDFLLSEFRLRVSKKRRIELTDRLAEGFKRASISVTAKEEQEEDRLLKELAKQTSSLDDDQVSYLLSFMRKLMAESVTPK
jgi:hypothetical protein